MMLRLPSEREQIASVAARWRDQYPDDGRILSGPNSNRLAGDVLWIGIACSECHSEGKESSAVVQADGGGDDAVYLCADCVSKLGALAGVSTTFVEFKRDPVQMMSIAVSWPNETYGPVSLFETTYMAGAAMRGWAEPSDPPGTFTVCLRANGESLWMSRDDARRLAAMLIAAANGVNAFDPQKNEAGEI